MLQPCDDLFFGFPGERVPTRGSIELMTRFNTKKSGYKDIVVKYVVIHASTSYNILLGRPLINIIEVIVSSLHLVMKFPSNKGSIIMVYVDKKTTRECYMTNLKLTHIQKILRSQANMVTLVDLNTTKA